IYAIADKRDLASLRHALHEADLIFWQEISFDVFARQSKLLADPQCDGPSVARHHGNLADTRLAKMIERLPRGRTHSVGHCNRPKQLASAAHPDDGLRASGHCPEGRGQNIRPRARGHALIAGPNLTLR